MIPDDLRETVIGWFGAEGQVWLDALPALVQRLADEWRLKLGAPFANGSASLVLDAREQDGRPAVLKVPLLDDENRGEAAALKHYSGRGAVRLYRHEADTGAMLLERVFPGVPLADVPGEEESIEIGCRVLRQLWKPPHAGHTFPMVRELAMQWTESIPREHARYGSPFPVTLISRAARVAGELAAVEGVDVVVNRDAHTKNILASDREGWLLIDPKPLVGDKAFDAGYVLLDRLGNAPTKARAEELIDRLARGLGLDAEQIRNWAFLRAVENALWALEVRSPPEEYVAQARALS